MAAPANMATGQTGDLTNLLIQWGKGSEQARDRLLPHVYDELRTLARRHLSRERPGHTVQTGTLVHEAFVRLIEGRPVPWEGRAHFFGIAARVMRQILVDHAAQGRAKRGDGVAASQSRARPGRRRWTERDRAWTAADDLSAIARRRRGRGAPVLWRVTVTKPRQRASRTEQTRRAWRALVRLAIAGETFRECDGAARLGAIKALFSGPSTLSDERGGPGTGGWCGRRLRRGASDARGP